MYEAQDDCGGFAGGIGSNFPFNHLWPVVAGGGGMRDTIDMARETKMPYDFVTGEPINLEKLKAFEALVRANEREACAKTTRQF